MNQELTSLCNFSDPASVVNAFIAAMNAWELESWQAMRAARSTDDPSAYQVRVAARMEQVFGTYCTQKDRPYGRHSSFQKPPECDPERER